MTEPTVYLKNLTAVFVFVLCFAHPLYGAEENQKSGDLTDFFQLKEKLQKAVCDESVIGKAPTLEATRVGEEAAAPIVVPIVPTQSQYYLKIPASESDFISFVLGDKQTVMAVPYLKDQVTKLLEKSEFTPSKLTELKRKISLDTCTALVTPGKLQKLMSEKPSWVVQTLDAGSISKWPFVGEDAVALKIQDVESRVGKVEGKYWVAGWIEQHETVAAKAGTGGRRLYRRVFNPITNSTLFVGLIGRDDVPIGFIYPSVDELVTDWSMLKLHAESESSRRRLVDVYRAMIEEDAYRAVSGKSKNTEQIRQLQEFYKNLISAYRIYPTESQFAQYAKRSAKMITEAEVKNVADNNFFAAVRRARVNGSKVSFSLFMPDPRLHGMYQEYRDRLRVLGR
ncbi:MAG: hypothetical protein A3K03_11390 [Bdellovibrionales bacterium RIFOXYD1_FULL_44_7]|nr:MAG: hypothetical protein A3K03_11390 [Bdellovibrionales bacterium RIFOXYD1_FULL_44_7]